MSWYALELELQRVNSRIVRYRSAWLGLWTVTAIIGLAAASTGQRTLLPLFVFFAVIAIGLTAWLQSAYFEEVRKRQQLVAEILRTKR